MDTAEGKPPLKTVSNAFNLLELLARTDDEPTLTELADRLTLSKPAVHRLLSTLESGGYVRKDPKTRGYALGVNLWRLGRAATDRLELRVVAHPFLERLSADLDQTSLLGVYSEHDQVAVYIDKVDASHLVALYSRVGGTAPLHATATGKVLLAHQNQPEIERYLARPLQKYNPNTITSVVKLRDQLRSVRERGWADNIGEWREGASSLAAPLWGPSGELAGALTLLIPTSARLQADSDSLSRTLVQTALEISRNLGYIDDEWRPGLDRSEVA